jgi:hypothetical protein
MITIVKICPSGDGSSGAIVVQLAFSTRGLSGAASAARKENLEEKS